MEGTYIVVYLQRVSYIGHALHRVAMCDVQEFLELFLPPPHANINCNAAINFLAIIKPIGQLDRLVLELEGILRLAAADR